MYPVELWVVIVVPMVCFLLGLGLILFLAYTWFRQRSHSISNSFQARMQFNVFTEQLFEALKFFTKKKLGALIILRKKNTLEKFLVRRGVLLDACCSTELLKNIFSCKNTTMHDGAMIIDRDYRIRYASTLVSIAAPTGNLKNFGSRHAAAVSIATQSDALVILVSESTQQIKYFYYDQQKKVFNDKNFIKLATKIKEWNDSIK